MDPNWQQVEEIFGEAIVIPPDQCEAFLSRACGNDTALRDEVESLLASHRLAGNFIQEPALGDALKLIERPAASLEQGHRIGPYEVIREIGRGGMGAVYLAARADDQYRKLVAIKVIKRGMDSDDILRRFRNERQILASLDHPNIARLLDGGTTEDGLPYFVLEYIDGAPFDRYCNERKLTTPERLQLFRRVCAAVQYAHQNLIIHRDLKPSNILVTDEAEPKLLDFGIAKILNPHLSEDGAAQTVTSMRLMTPDYASPEQILGKRVTTAADVYSLGVVLYEALTGVRPYKFTHASLEELSYAIRESEPPRPSAAVSDVGLRESSSVDPLHGRKSRKVLKGDLDNIVLMALRKEPQRRYSSVAEFSADIQRHIDGLPVMARKDTLAYRVSKFVLRNRVAVVASALILVTLITGVALTVREKRKADRRFNDVRRLATSLIFEVDDEIQKGPTKGRAMIAKRALDYLDNLARESGDEPGLQLELAAVYLKVGDIQGKPYRPNLGDTNGAEASYHKALVLLESLTAAEPANREAMRYLSLSYQNLGRVQMRNSKWNESLENQRRAVAISEELLKVNPSNSQYRSLLADNYLHLGEALYQRDRGATIADHHQAIEYFRKALAIHSSLVESEPNDAEYRYATGVDYEYVGIAFNRLGDMTGDAQNYRQALENHRKELEINEALAASDPSNASYRRIVADVYGEVGLSQMKLGETDEAIENLRHRLAIFESIGTSDPTNIEARRDVANSLFEIGQALARAGDLPGGLAQERKAVLIQEALREAEPANNETRGSLLDLYEASGEMEMKHGDYEAAFATYKKALALLESWAVIQPELVQVRRLFAVEQTNIARVHEAAALDRKTSVPRRQVHWRSARDRYQLSLNVWQELRTGGLLSETDENAVAEVTKAISRCDAFLTTR